MSTGAEESARSQLLRLLGWSPEQLDAVLAAWPVDDATLLMLIDAEDG